MASTHVVAGREVMGDEPVEVRFDRALSGVDSLLSAPPGLDFLSPGFIDLQVNGFAGVDYNTPGASHEQIARSLQAQFATGVTRLYATVITGPVERMQACLRNLARAREALPSGKAIEGFHVEGPFISPEDGPRGAHPVEHVRPPDLQEFQRMQEAAEGHVRLVTVSPEWPGAPAFIEAVVGEGVVASIGHTKATAGQIADAVQAGATMSTHLGNGAHGMLPRHPNYLWDQLAEDRLAAGFIVDGIHVGAAFLKTAIRAKGIHRSFLVTDAVMPAGCPPGEYRLGDVDVELKHDARVVLRGDTRLAGSSLHMHHAIGNAVRMAGISLRDAVAMATTNPARVGRIASRQRGLSPGERADLVRFRYHAGEQRLEILETYLSGERVYRA